ncbi:SusD/RagB family nutrient-binding outer membrane lipoprotein [Hymenobacter cellulosilyticus]|uniref:SusD/RagB family nutrient-binding outer membrane lipoprotein n=1 Tax=Hymenobacter cellulosilyticus TaxID=2932248 RepID=A0A8T9Q990_9BACT|nr:SusD/RagB family nutrient-binding outer membrane lipoprotein [Hymenobacter cellulosilyticus]UOQ72079.1 SusD/RagB family nutrient-binding outer membrane lipoprotein [Hymenobacter cellulosilyticus]
MKKALLFCIPAVLFASSCSKLEDYDNINPKAATTAPGVSLVSNAERMLSNTINTPDYNINPFRLYVQYWAETTYPDESQYIIATRQINRNFWDPLYRDVLSDLNEGKRIIAADNLLNADIKANQIACIEVLEVYTWSVLVNTFGDVPYSAALNSENLTPKYDDDKVIYTDLIKRLNTAITSMKSTATGLGTADLYYSGSMARWMKFANSLKLRLALTIADDDAATSKTLAQEAAADLSKLLSSNEDNAKLKYLSAVPNTNPLYVSLVQSGRADFVGANTFIDKLNAWGDPRIDEYFKPFTAATPTTPAVFKGGTYGAPNVYANNSAPGAILEDPTFAGTLMNYAEVEFMLAEAQERGYTIGGTGTAADHYNAGVTASVTEWGGTTAEATAYLKNPTVAYATAKPNGGTAPATWQEKIGYQKWVALYNNPVEAWKEWRRLDSPKLEKPAKAISEIPLRLPYPTTEANLNGANYNAASAAIGGDVVTSRIFWDKK